MSGSVVVKLDNVSKYYKLYNSPKDRLKEALHPFRKKYHKEFFALNNISFELRRGECLGIIGKNGMGKSTLLKIIANVIQPSFGSVQINGSVSALLELGTGFNPEFTGMENIYFYGTILGFRKNEVERRVKEIVDFADIGEFIDQPVKTYSSGMFVRLAFAVQTSLKPDILLVDEVLSVGDIFFQQKCHARIEELLGDGTALILVSHDTTLIEKYSKRVLLLADGNCVLWDEPYKTIHRYFSMGEKKIISKNLTKEINRKEDLLSEAVISTFGNIPWPDDNKFVDCKNVDVIGDIKTAELTRVAVTNKEEVKQSLFRIDEPINIYYEFKILEDIGVPVGGIEIRNSLNVFVHGKNTLQYGISDHSKAITLKAGAIVRMRQSFKLSLMAGEYIFSLGLASIDLEDYEDYLTGENFNIKNKIKMVLRIPQAGKFTITADVIKDNNFFGCVNLEGEHQYEFIY